MLGDEVVFAQKAALMPEGIVTLNSRGGNLYAGLMIADEVRRRGFTTYVKPGRECASACALILVSGGHVIVSDKAWVGFDAAAQDADGAVSPRGPRSLPNICARSLD